MEGIEIVFHEAAIRITHCAEDPRLAHDTDTEFAEVVKSGRTHLMDATPVTLGQEFGGYGAQVEDGAARIGDGWLMTPTNSSLGELNLVSSACFAIAFVAMRTV
mgnify:CR=1 FL=1